MQLIIETQFSSIGIVLVIIQFIFKHIWEYLCTFNRLLGAWFWYSIKSFRNHLTTFVVHYKLGISERPIIHNNLPVIKPRLLSRLRKNWCIICPIWFFHNIRHSLYRCSLKEICTSVVSADKCISQDNTWYDNSTFRFPTLSCAITCLLFLRVFTDTTLFTMRTTNILIWFAWVLSKIQCS